MIVLLVAAVSSGIALLVTKNSSNSPGVEIFLPTATPTAELVVYISGAVAEPGVYSVKDGDRLVDAISAAGGATLDAQLSCVNLAIRVKDEAHYHLPSSDEPCESVSSPVADPVSDDKIDLNTATANRLEELPGIGPAKAKSIVDHRNVNGPFRSTEEVMNVSGIGAITYENIRDLVTVRSGSR